VVALQELLRHELQAVVGRLGATLAVLAGTVFTLVERALGTAPQVHPEAAVNLVLRIRALAHAALHRSAPRFAGTLCCPDRPDSSDLLGREASPNGPPPRSPEEARNIL